VSGRPAATAPERWPSGYRGRRRLDAGRSGITCALLPLVVLGLVGPASVAVAQPGPAPVEPTMTTASGDLHLLGMPATGLLWLVAGIALAAVGLVIATRRPRRATGPLGARTVHPGSAIDLAAASSAALAPVTR
jgi:hypothetical protein